MKINWVDETQMKDIMDKSSNKRIKVEETISDPIKYHNNMENTLVYVDPETGEKLSIGYLSTESKN